MVFIWNCSDWRTCRTFTSSIPDSGIGTFDHSHNVEVSGLDINAAAGSPSTDGIDVIARNT